MILTVKTTDLKQALQPYKKVLTNKTNFILSGIKLTADQLTQTLTIEGTDLELFMKTVLNAKVQTSGSTIVPFKNIENLSQINKENETSINLIENKKMVKSSKHPEITKTDEDGKEYQAIDYDTNIETEEEIIEQTLQIYKLKLNTFDLEEYPNWITLNQEGIKTSQNLDFKTFTTAISKIIDFVSKDESRVILTGILLNTSDNEIVGTDSYKLAVQTYDFKQNLEIEREKVENEYQEYNNPFYQIVLPSRVYDLLKMIKAENFTINRTSENIEFIIDNMVIVSRLLTGKYPAYERLIPIEESFNYIYKVNSQDVIKTLDEAEKLLNNKDDIPVKIQSDHNKMLFTMVNKEVGNYESEIGVETIKTENITEPLQFAVNPSYLKICLKNMTEPTIKIVDPLRPIVIEEDQELKILLMPIRIN